MVIKGVKHRLQPKTETPKQPEVKKAVKKAAPMVEPVAPVVKEEILVKEENLPEVEVLPEEEDLI